MPSDCEFIFFYTVHREQDKKKSCVLHKRKQRRTLHVRWNHAPERLDYYDCHDLQGSALSEHVVKGVGNQLLQEQAKAKLRPKEIVWVYQQVCVCLNHAPLPLQGERSNTVLL